MTSPFAKSKSFNQRAFGVGTPRSLSFGSPRVSSSRLSVISRWFNALVVLGCLVSFSIAIAGSYFYVLPNLSQAFHGVGSPVFNESVANCDLFDGQWVVDDGYPLYNASECPFAEQGFDCIGNGREDEDYIKWRWKPRDCVIPRFNVSYVLERLRSKRVVFVGDSMSRTQWESLICLLMTGVEDKKSVYEVNNNKITKRIRYLCVRFSSFNFTIEFFRSVFLVEHGWMPRRAPKRVRSTLRLDKMDDISYQWVNSDILIFNTGQWWVPWKLFDTGCYFQVGDAVQLGMSIPSAFRIALETWAAWVKDKIETGRTRVFFRTFEPSHWSKDQPRRFCNVTLHPTSQTIVNDSNMFSEAILDVVRSMAVPITVLHVTSMSAFRSDAHVGKWNNNPSGADCSHWCLPGVPDMWNEILLSLLLY